MDQLRLGGPEAQAAALDGLQEIQREALSDDTLYQGLPSREANRARSDFSSALQTLMGDAVLARELNARGQELAPKTALADGLNRAAELAAAPEFDAASFKGLAREVLERAGAERFQGELSALDGIGTPREALYFLMRLKGRLVQEGAAGPALNEKVESFRRDALAASDSQFTCRAASPADGLIRPPRVEAGPFVDQALTIAVRLEADPGDQAARGELARLEGDMELLGLGTPAFNKETLGLIAGTRTLIAEARSGGLDTDILAQAAMDIDAKLPGLPDGPDKTLLTSDRAKLETFRQGLAAALSSEVEDRLQDAAQVSAGPPEAAKIEEAKKGLDGALARLDQNSQAGQALKGDLKARVAEAQDRLELKLVDASLAALKSSKVTSGSMEALAATYAQNPAAMEAIRTNSAGSASELLAEISALKVPDVPSAGAAVAADIKRLEGRIGRMLLPDDAARANEALSARKAELSAAIGARLWRA